MPSQTSKLKPACVDVWRCRLDIAHDQIMALNGLLSTEELDRARRLKVAEKREQFIITRARLRQVLGAYLEVEPQSLDFAYSVHGKPVAGKRWVDRGFQFNVSHTIGLALVAVSSRHPVGVDIEKIRQDDRDYAALVRRYFSRQEQSDLMVLPEAERMRAFYACWTRKEAFVKAVGDGITFGLDTFDISIRPEEARPRLTLRGRDGGDNAWSVFNLPVGEDYMAALAIAGANPNVRCQDWQGP